MDIQFIKQLSEQGILALLLSISIVANWYFVRGWLSEKDKRTSDARLVSDKIIEPLDNLKKTLDNMNVLLQAILKNE